MSVALSGLVVSGLGCVFLTALQRAGLNRLDREITALGESHLRRRPPPEHWTRLGLSLRYSYGDDYDSKIVFKAISPEGVLHHQSEKWSTDDFDAPLALPEQTAVASLRRDRLAPGDMALDDVDVEDGGPAPFDDMRGPGPGPRHGRGPDRRPRRRPPQTPSASDAPLTQPSFMTLSADGGQWRVGRFETEHLVLAIGVNLEGVASENKRFAHVLWVAVPLALLLLGIVGWMLACHALKPVNVIARTAEGISAEDLGLRIPSLKADREFSVLIDTINGMLSRLESSFHQAARFSADAAHELKTPLTILQGQLDQAIQEASDGSSDQKVYAGLLEEVIRMKAIVTKLLLLAQVDAGRLRVTRESLNLSKMVALCVEDLELQASDITIETDIQDEVWVSADSIMLPQVLVNLLSNAIKYNGANGHIRLALAKVDGQAQFRIANTGVMIPDEDRERIFERFFRADKAHARTNDGVGLGLSLAREIVRSHGGQLTVTSAEAG